MRKAMVPGPQSPAGRVFSVVWGCMFVLIGVFVVIPTFGLLGLIWTGVAVGITAANLWQAFGKKSAQAHKTAAPTTQQTFNVSDERHEHILVSSESKQNRLKQLDTLKGAGLLDEVEYRQKREEILKKV